MCQCFLSHLQNIPPDSREQSASLLLNPNYILKLWVDAGGESRKTHFQPPENLMVSPLIPSPAIYLPCPWNAYNLNVYSQVFPFHLHLHVSVVNSKHEPTVGISADTTSLYEFHHNCKIVQVLPYFKRTESFHFWVKN